VAVGNEAIPTYRPEDEERRDAAQDHQQPRYTQPLRIRMGRQMSGHMALAMTRSASFTRSSPEMSLGNSASRRDARVTDSRRQSSVRASTSSATCSNAPAMLAGGTTTLRLRTDSAWARWWLLEVPVTSPSIC